MVLIVMSFVAGNETRYKRSPDIGRQGVLIGTLGYLGHRRSFTQCVVKEREIGVNAGASPNLFLKLRTRPQPNHPLYVTDGRHVAQKAA